MRPWVLAETNYAYVKEHPYEVAVLPFGATEPHNLHLPYGTDTFEAEVIGQRACEEAFRRGARVVLLPTIPYGTETNQRRCSMSMNLNPSTLLAVLRDLVDSLADHGVHKLLVLNSHGGNDFKPFLRELYGTTPVHIFLCDWFRGCIADVRDRIFDHPDDHAGEMETSLALAFFPDLVARDPHTGAVLADAGSTRPVRFEAVRRGWVTLTRPWHLLTTNTGAGDPRQATAEKGRRLMEVLVERIAGFLVELAAAPLDETFPFVPETGKEKS
ncbi:MAG: creatininase family protein [Planctomycetota bacterium]|nr:MAG: creatininase family protein [Planctomycetota bacterium]